MFLFILQDSSIFEFGYANLDKFFELAPWVLMFLVPAITMRLFADEFKVGTFEILRTKPLTNMNIILGKYFSIIIIIAAHIPIFTLQRHEGKIFAPMAYTVTSALIGSLIISLTVIPMLCHLFLNKDIGHEDSKFVHWCKDRYRAALDWALNSKAKVLKIAGGLMLVTIIVAKLLGSEFLPRSEEQHV